MAGSVWCAEILRGSVLYKHNELLCYGGHDTVAWNYLLSDNAKLIHVASNTSGCESTSLVYPQYESIRDLQSRDPGRFPNPEIPGLSRCQSRDFEIIEFYLLNLFYTFFQSILRIYPFTESTSRVISSRCLKCFSYLLTNLLMTAWFAIENSIGVPAQYTEI